MYRCSICKKNKYNIDLKKNKITCECAFCSTTMKLDSKYYYDHFNGTFPIDLKIKKNKLFLSFDKNSIELRLKRSK